MSARAFLVRGLLAGLLAGLATFFVAHQVGEPPVDAAIALEEAGHAHHHEGDEPEGPVVSRDHQRTWGLLTGTVAVGVALGGLVALVAAVAAGRMRRVTLGQSTALVTAIGFVSFALVPFLKYPANPPAVGSPDTIGDRTGAYFGFVAVSLAVAVLVTAVGLRLAPRVGTYRGVVGSVAAYLTAMTAAGAAFPTVDEVGDFPADTLWDFRLASLLVLATLWAVIGVVLTGLLLRLQSQDRAVVARRELAASL